MSPPILLGAPKISAKEAGWQVPDWYVDLKTTAVPILGTAGAMRAAANAAGLAGIVVQERPVDVGVTEPEQLVSYRLGQPLFAGWLDRTSPAGPGKSHPTPPTQSVPSCSRTGRSSCSLLPARRPASTPA